MAGDGKVGEGSSSSPSGGRGPANSGDGRPRVQTRNSVRFSEDVDRPEPGIPSTQQTELPSLRIDTSPQSQQATGIERPSDLGQKKTSNTVSTNSPRTRDRGYSLRRTLFARGISHQPTDNNIELAESRPVQDDTRRLEEGRAKQLKGDVSVSPIIENDLTVAASADGSTPSTTRKGKDRKHFGSISLPNYDVWAQKRSRKSIWAKNLKEYKKRAIDIVLRRKQIPASKDGRHIALDASRKENLIDERTGGEYIGNTIRSSRYTLWNFLPRQLIFQFSKLANAYFLLVSILQMIPGLSTVGTYTTLAPLLVFVAISMAKEGYDDVRRYKLDQIENKKVVSDTQGL